MNEWLEADGALCKDFHLSNSQTKAAAKCSSRKFINRIKIAAQDISTSKTDAVIKEEQWDEKSGKEDKTGIKMKEKRYKKKKYLI